MLFICLFCVVHTYISSDPYYLPPFSYSPTSIWNGKLTHPFSCSCYLNWNQIWDWHKWWWTIGNMGTYEGKNIERENVKRVPYCLKCELKHHHWSQVSRFWDVKSQTKGPIWWRDIDQMRKPFLSFKLISNDKNHFNFNNFFLHWFKICETTSMYTTSLKAFDESHKCKEGPTIWEG